jgi:hypothetical protein
VHRGFELVGRILDRMEQIENQWRDFLDDFAPRTNRDGCPRGKEEPVKSTACSRSASLLFPDKMHFLFQDCPDWFSIPTRRWLRSFDRCSRLGRRPPAGFWYNCLRIRLKPFCSNVGAAEIALSSTWRSFVPSPNARNTSATAPAAAVATGAVRCSPSGSASGSGPGSVGPMRDTRRRWSPTASRRGCGNWMARRPG